MIENEGGAPAKQKLIAPPPLKDAKEKVEVDGQEDKQEEQEEGLSTEEGTEQENDDEDLGEGDKAEEVESVPLVVPKAKEPATEVVTFDSKASSAWYDMSRSSKFLFFSSLLSGATQYIFTSAQPGFSSSAVSFDGAPWSTGLDVGHSEFGPAWPMFEGSPQDRLAGASSSDTSLGLLPGLVEGGYVSPNNQLTVYGAPFPSDVNAAGFVPLAEFKGDSTLRGGDFFVEERGDGSLMLGEGGELGRPVRMLGLPPIPADGPSNYASWNGLGMNLTPGADEGSFGSASYRSLPESAPEINGEEVVDDKGGDGLGKEGDGRGVTAPEEVVNQSAKTHPLSSASKKHTPSHDGGGYSSKTVAGALAGVGIASALGAAEIERRRRAAKAAAAHASTTLRFASQGTPITLEAMREELPKIKDALDKLAEIKSLNVAFQESAEKAGEQLEDQLGRDFFENIEAIDTSVTAHLTKNPSADSDGEIKGQIAEIKSASDALKAKIAAAKTGARDIGLLSSVYTISHEDYSSSQQPQRTATSPANTSVAGVYEEIDRVVDGSIREHTVTGKDTGAKSVRFTEERSGAKLEKMTLVDFPATGDAAEEKAKMIGAIAMATQFCAGLKDLPSASSKIVLSGSNEEELKYVWMALLVVGASAPPGCQFGAEAIDITQARFTPPVAQTPGEETHAFYHKALASSNFSRHTDSDEKLLLDVLQGEIAEIVQDKFSDISQATEQARRTTQTFKEKLTDTANPKDAGDDPSHGKGPATK